MRHALSSFSTEVYLACANTELLFASNPLGLVSVHRVPESPNKNLQLSRSPESAADQPQPARRRRQSPSRSTSHPNCATPQIALSPSLRAHPQTKTIPPSFAAGTASASLSFTIGSGSGVASGTGTGSGPGVLRCRYGMHRTPCESVTQKTPVGITNGGFPT